MFRVVSRRKNGILTPYASTAAAGLWSPTAGLSLWLRADSIAGLADGAAVATWNDDSGNANHASQATAGNRPLYKTNIRNGLPAVRFDGVNDYLTLTSNLIVGPATVLIVFSKSLHTTGYKALLSAQKIAVFAAISASANWGSYTDAEQDSSYLVGTSPSLATVVFTAANNVDLLTNGNALVNRTSGSSFPARSSTGIGADATGVQFFGGDIHEILAYDSALGTTTTDAARAYLSAKWLLY